MQNLNARILFRQLEAGVACFKKKYPLFLLAHEWKKSDDSQESLASPGEVDITYSGVHLHRN